MTYVSKRPFDWANYAVSAILAIGGMLNILSYGLVSAIILRMGCFFLGIDALSPGVKPGIFQLMTIGYLLVSVAWSWLATRSASANGVVTGTIMAVGFSLGMVPEALFNWVGLGLGILLTGVLGGLVREGRISLGWLYALQVLLLGSGLANLVHQS